MRIIVQNLSFNTSETELRDIFSSLGEIVECALAYDAAGKSRGFGFITFAERESVVKATAEGSPPIELGGRELRIQIANQKRDAGKSKVAREVKAFGPKLYCGDLPWELSAEELTSHFEEYGKVENAYLAEVQYAAPVNGYKPHRGFGFVEFATEEEATKALKATHEIKGANVRVTSAKGEAKGGERKRREKNDNDNSNNAGGGGGNRQPKKDERKRGDGGESRKPKKEATNNTVEEKQVREKESKPEASRLLDAPKKKQPVVAAAPTVNPWGKAAPANGAGASGVAGEVNASDYPTLADVTSGKVKAHIKTEDEIASEMAALRAAEAKGKGKKQEYEGKGKEEA